MGTVREADRLRIGQESSSVLLVAGLILTLSLTMEIPVGDSLVVPGQVTVGPAVLTISDLYLAFVTLGLVLYHRELRIPRSSTVLAIAGFAGAVLLSGVVNGLDASGLLEVIQWVEMGVLAVVVGLLLRRDWERHLSLRLLVYIGTLRAAWTLGYFLLNGYPGRRFNVLIAGAALVLLIGLVAHEGWTRIDLAQVAILLPTVLIGQERKVWVAIAGAAVVMAVAYAFRTRDGYRVGLTLLKGALIGAVLGVLVYLFLLPPNVQERLFSLIELLPGIGGEPQFERAYLVATGLEMFAHNPLFGVGPENWFEAKSTYATDNLVAYELRTGSDLGPHSIFIKTLAEAGVIGVTALLLLLVRPFRFLGWYLKSAATSTLLLPLLGLFCFAVAVASVRAGGFVSRAYLFLIFGFLLSFELHTVSSTRHPSTESSRPRPES